MCKALLDVQRCVLDFWGVLEVFYTLFASRLLSTPCATPLHNGVLRAFSRVFQGACFATRGVPIVVYVTLSSHEYRIPQVQSQTRRVPAATLKTEQSAVNYVSELS